MGGSYFLLGSDLENCVGEKRPFFRAGISGLGKYHTGGYGQIGVYRDGMFAYTCILGATSTYVEIARKLLIL